MNEPTTKLEAANDENLPVAWMTEDGAEAVATPRKEYVESNGVDLSHFSVPLYRSPQPTYDENWKYKEFLACALNRGYQDLTALIEAHDKMRLPTPMSRDIVGLHHPTVPKEQWSKWLNKKDCGMLVTMCCNAQHIVPVWAWRNYGLDSVERRCTKCGNLVEIVDGTLSALLEGQQQENEGVPVAEPTVPSSAISSG